MNQNKRSQHTKVHRPSHAVAWQRQHLGLPLHTKPRHSHPMSLLTHHAQALLNEATKVGFCRLQPFLAQLKCLVANVWIVQVADLKAQAWPTGPTFEPSRPNVLPLFIRMLQRRLQAGHLKNQSPDSYKVGPVMIFVDWSFFLITPINGRI